MIPTYDLEPSEWRYEMRREAQLILPNLYLGPHSASRNFNALKENGITHILCIRDPLERAIAKPHFPDHFSYHFIELSDSPLANLLPHLRGATEFIDRALNGGGTGMDTGVEGVGGRGGRVLVHSINGISRAPSIVVAYLMEKRTMDYETAFRYLLSKRFCVCLNLGFVRQLKEYEPLLLAKAQCAGTDEEQIRHLKRSWPKEEE